MRISLYDCSGRAMLCSLLTSNILIKYIRRSSRLLKKTHMLRCRSIASLRRTVSTPPLVDFSRVLPLDLFEQPARGLFQHPASVVFLKFVEEVQTMAAAEVELNPPVSLLKEGFSSMGS
jgi:hypothetical protein